MPTIFDTRNAYNDYLVNSVVKPSTNSGSLPKGPKPGDTFFYGTLANEPIEWKVLEVYDNGTFFAVTAKVILKMCYDGLLDWLNTDFLDNVFTEDEKKHIVACDYDDIDIQSSDLTYLYLPARSQLEALEDLSQPFEETALASSMSRNDSIYDINGRSIEHGGYSCINRDVVRGIRPVMDLYIEAPVEEKDGGEARAN